jgi:hypothetical protein
MQFIHGHGSAQVGHLSVPKTFMAPIAADAMAKPTGKAHVEAIFSELPEDVTAALINKSATHL